MELHVRASDWARHHHGEDPGYNEVILQVVLWNDATHCKRSDGESVPLLALAPFIEGSWERLSPLASGASHSCTACSRAVQQRGEEAVLAQLAELALARLRAKAAIVTGEIERNGACKALVAALLAAVALPAKGEWPRQVAESLPLDTLPGDQNALGELLEGAWKASAPPRRGYRPTGAPGPRLRVLASLLARWREDLAMRMSEAVLVWREAPQYLEKTLQEAGLTPAQAVEWAANAVLPWAVAWSQVSHQPALVEAAEAIFVSLPKRQEYGVTTRHAEALFGASGAAKVRTVAQQQGLLHLEKTLCPQGACPWQEIRDARLSHPPAPRVPRT